MTIMYVNWLFIFAVIIFIGDVKNNQVSKDDPSEIESERSLANQNLGEAQLRVKRAGGDGKKQDDLPKKQSRTTTSKKRQKQSGTTAASKTKDRNISSSPADKTLEQAQKNPAGNKILSPVTFELVNPDPSTAEDERHMVRDEDAKTNDLGVYSFHYPKASPGDYMLRFERSGGAGFYMGGFGKGGAKMELINVNLI